MITAPVMKVLNEPNFQDIRQQHRKIGFQSYEIMTPLVAASDSCWSISI